MANLDTCVRNVDVDDLDAVLELYEAAGLDARGENDRQAARAFFAQIIGRGGQVLLLEHAGRAVGTLTLFVLPLLAHRGRSAALVEDVAVHPDMQGRGLGRRLMNEAMLRARAAGCYKLALSSNIVRTAAHAFYERLGFQRHGVSFVVDLGEPA